MESIRNISLFGASSSQIPTSFKDQAYRLGKILAQNRITCHCGGGRAGIMGSVIDSMLEAQGDIIGYLPQFMMDHNWHHPLIKKVVVTANMHERKQQMIAQAELIIAMPGAVGTLEELLEVLTWKQLGLLSTPICLVNIDHFFDPLLALLDQTISLKLMADKNRDMWYTVDSVEDIFSNSISRPQWPKNAEEFAAL